MKIVGPLIRTWAMRLEAKHQPIKQSGITSMNNKNLPKTIAIKQQLCSAKVFFNNDSFEELVCYEDFHDNLAFKTITIHHVNSNNYHRIKSVTIKNIKYTVDSIIKLTKHDLPTYCYVRNDTT